jgi:hypothetical protein
MNNNFNNTNTNNINNNTNNTNNTIIDNTNDFTSRIRIYLLIISISYFLIKILYSPFKIYPNKYNYNKFLLKSCQNTKIDKYLENYTPDIWNSELYDLLIVITLCILLFLFKFNNVFPKDKKNSFINKFLWLSFIIGLIIPPLYTFIYSYNNELNDLINIVYKNSDLNNIMNEKSTSKNLLINIESICIIIIGIITIITTILTNLRKNIIWYCILVSITIFICIGIFFSKRNKTTYTSINYTDKDGENTKNHIIVSNYEEFLKNPAFPSILCWIILLFIPFNNNLILNIINGFLLGYFISRVSFFGIQYPFQSNKSDSCSSQEECKNKKIPYYNIDDIDKNKLASITDVNNNLQSRININTWTILGISIIIIIFIVLILIQKM